MYNYNRLISRMVLFTATTMILSGCGKKEEILEAVDITADEAKVMVEAAVSDFKTQQQSFSDARQASKTGSPIVAGSLNPSKVTANTWVFNSSDSSYIGDITKTNGSLHYICTFYTGQNKKQTQYNPLTSAYLKWITTADLDFSYQLAVGAQSKFNYAADYNNVFTVEGISSGSDSIVISGQTAVSSALVWKSSADVVQLQSSSEISGEFKSIRYSKTLTNLWPLSGSVKYSVDMNITKQNAEATNKNIKKSITITFNGNKNLTVVLENYSFSVDLDNGTVTKL